MPRTIDSHLNERDNVLPTDVVDDVGRNHLADKARRIVEEALRQELPDRKQSLLLEAIGYYRWEKQHGPYRYKRAEARKPLIDIMKRGTFQHDEIASLNERAFSDLFIHLDDRDTQAWMMGARSKSPIRRSLIRALNTVGETHKDQRGPEMDVALMWLIIDLCEIYTLQTGNSVTHHNTANDRGYDWEPQSPAGQFVTLIVQAVDSEVRPSLISSYLERYRRRKAAPSLSD